MKRFSIVKLVNGTKKRMLMRKKTKTKQRPMAAVFLCKHRMAEGFLLIDLLAIFQPDHFFNIVVTTEIANEFHRLAFSHGEHPCQLIWAKQAGDANAERCIAGYCYHSGAVLLGNGKRDVVVFAIFLNVINLAFQ